jgi:hypothetical protein
MSNKELLMNKELLIDKEILMNIERERLSCCDKIALWWFFHSTPNGASSYGGENAYFTCFNCCPGNLELKYSKYYCKKEKVCFCCCFSIMFM